MPRKLIKYQDYTRREVHDIFDPTSPFTAQRGTWGLPLYRIAIECDGKEYHSNPEQRRHDQRKNRYLRKNGWRVLRFSGRSINRNMNKVIARIEKAKK